MKKILIVEDDPGYLDLLKRVFIDEGYEIATALTSAEAINMVQYIAFDAMITDLTMQGMNGIELMERFKKIHPDLPIIIITGQGTIEYAVEAMKKGAYDFIKKPFDLDEIRTTVKRALAYGEFHSGVNRPGIEEVQDKYVFHNIIAKSKCMQDIFVLIEKIADSTTTILLQGETGTGKEMFAKAIHSLSRRKDKPFLPVNCSAMPANILEEDLFGHTKDAFRGAVHAGLGLFDFAAGGTIFLDEIDDISLVTQSKLLRVLQDKEIRPLGSNRSRGIDVRIITSTNKDLRELIRKEVFREDLFFRIAMIPIYIPPLRERKEDIPLLAAHFIEKYSRPNKKKVRGISREALFALTSYDWPGNVREMESAIERALFICGDGQIELQHLIMGGHGGKQRYV